MDTKEKVQQKENEGLITEDIPILQDKEESAFGLSEKSVKLNHGDLSLLFKLFDGLNLKMADFIPISHPLPGNISECIRSGFMNLSKPSNPRGQELVSWIKPIPKVQETGPSGIFNSEVIGCSVMCMEKDDIFLIISKQSVDETRNAGVFWVKCKPGTYVPIIFLHVGLTAVTAESMVEIKSIRTGTYKESDGTVKYDLLNAQTFYEDHGEESYLRKIIKTLEELLIKRDDIIINDSVAKAVCYDTKPLLEGILSYEGDIKFNKDIAVQLACCKDRATAMEKDTYPKKLVRGPRVSWNKILNTKGLLTSFEELNKNKLKMWLESYMGLAASRADVKRSTIQPELKKKPKIQKKCTLSIAGTSDSATEERNKKEEEE